MPLDAAQLQKVQNWMASKGVRGQCPYCGGSSGSSAGEIIAAPTHVGGGIAIGGPTVPMLQIVCNNCGHVSHFAAVPMGLA